MALAPIVLPTLKWVTSPNFSSRTSPVTMVVLHDTEGNYAGAVNWFHSASSAVSAHIVLREDGLEATQMVPYSKKAWHCAAFNSESIGLEMAGVAAKGFGSSELRHAARIVAYFLHRYNLPARLLSESDALAHRKGWTAHQCLGAAGGGHHDPGFSKAKLWWFNLLVKVELRRAGFRPDWGKN